MSKCLMDEMREVPAELKSQAFESKSVAQRAFVIAARPLANFYFCDFGILGHLCRWNSSVKPVIEKHNTQFSGCNGSN